MPSEPLISQATFFIVGTILGALLLLAGLGAGLWLGRRISQVTSKPEIDADQTVHLLGGMFQWANGLAGDVAQHREIISKLAARIDSASGTSGRDSRRDAGGLLTEIVSANEQLKKRLAEAENTLKTQADEVAGYLSEARTDSLTELPNRRALDDELKRRITEANRNGGEVSFALVDVDLFKTLNDRFGHLAGDRALVDVGRLLQSTVKDAGFVSRFGGDEFAVVLPDIDSARAARVLEKARKAIESFSREFDGQELDITISCGVAQSRTDESVSSLLKRTDQALYAVKKAGRNAVRFHDGRRTHPVCDAEVLYEPQGPMVTTQLSAACDDLRQRLLQVAERGNQI